LRENDPGLTDPDFLRARSGEGAAFAALVRSRQRLVYGIALRMLDDRALAEDLSQEVFLQLHRSLGSIESVAHLEFWLRRVTAHRSIDYLRRRPRAQWAPVAAAEELPAPGSDEDPLMQSRLRGLVGQLSPVPRAVLLLRYQQDLDPGEIARTLDLPVNTVKSHLKRSLAALRAQLSAEGVPLSPEPPGGGLVEHEP
jgi:RNA polymerase sigma-70 factor (ECF subfamily)